MSGLIASAALLAQEAEAEEPSPLMPHLSELIVGLVAFALLFFFLSRTVFPMFEKTYAERTAAIEGGMKQAEQAQAEAQQALEEYRRQLADARGEASRIREEARIQGAAILAEMRDECAGRVGADHRPCAGPDRGGARTGRAVLASGGGHTRYRSSRAGSSASRSRTTARSQRVVERFLAELESTQASGNGAGPADREA